VAGKELVPRLDMQNSVMFSHPAIGGEGRKFYRYAKIFEIESQVRHFIG